ncbi:hypothetical protein U8C35_06525 [Sinorhizobium medicae]|uniref:hypothetical protein n=1 Tax=Sinorhizobium medicae TaxID=110321 RepID=UPI002AF6C633|nr:hypothetical protein [Sinorhizobium medicae]WQO60088.1 hypothetical protein U8C35_06525 [Sinorhizobium medicae]
MLANAFLDLLATYHREVALGLLGLMGGAVRVAVAIYRNEPMPPSLIFATLTASLIIPATGGDLVQDWFRLSGKAAGFCSFMTGVGSIKIVLKMIDVDPSWGLSSKGGKRR